MKKYYLSIFFSIIMFYWFSIFQSIIYAQENSAIKAKNFENEEWVYRYLYPVTSLNTLNISTFIQNNGEQAQNIYKLKENYVDSFVKNTLSFSTVWMFDNNGYRRLHGFESGCLSENFLTKIPANIESAPIDTLFTLSKVLSNIEAITVNTFNKNYPTAIIFWNRSLGMHNDRNIFDWKANLLLKFENKINIIYVSTDAFDDWDTSIQERHVDRLNKIVLAIKAYYK